MRYVWASLIFLAAYAACVSGAAAHEVRPAYLELRQTSAETYNVFFKVPGRGESQRLALDVEFPAGTVNITAPSVSSTDQAFSKRWVVKRTGGLSGRSLRIIGLEATVTDALVRVQLLDGTVQVMRLTPSSPSLMVRASPEKRWGAITYLPLGVEHILNGFDHLLFVLALILIVPGRRRLLLTITAFTVAHSITLGLATLGFLHVPHPPVEAVIAMSILLLATEILRMQRGQDSLTARRPWVVAFTFGLLHGFGFASALSDIGLPRGDVPLALLMFNCGVELGQLAFITLVLSALTVARKLKRLAAAGPYAPPAVAYGIGTLAAFWFFERLAEFAGTDVLNAPLP